MANRISPTLTYSNEFPQPPESVQFPKPTILLILNQLNPSLRDTNHTSHNSRSQPRYTYATAHNRSLIGSP